jgi:hypothetical protein
VGSVETILATAAQARVRKGPPCSVCTLIESLPDGESQALVTLLSDPGVRYSWLADQLRDQGIADIDAGGYARHARGGCLSRVKLR